MLGDWHGIAGGRFDSHQRNISVISHHVKLSYLRHREVAVVEIGIDLDYRSFDLVLPAGTRGQRFAIAPRLCDIYGFKQLTGQITTPSSGRT